MKPRDDNDLYIACIDLHDRDVVVIGGGPVALEKIESLVAAKARVKVVSPVVTDRLHEMADAREIEWVRKRYDASDLDNTYLAVVATGDIAVARRAYQDAEARRLLINVADVPELCSFILPAVVREGPIAVAISTRGASPALAQRLRDEIRQLLARPYAALARKLRDLRPWARASLATYDERRDFFSDIVNGRPDPLVLLENGDEQTLERAIANAKRKATTASRAT